MSATIFYSFSIKINKMFDRKKQIKWASLKVGIVITLTLLIILFVIVFSGGIQSIFTTRILLNVSIVDVKGLRPGAPVRIAGVDVGEVKEIKLSQQHGTIVKISVDREILNFLKSDATATVQTLGLLGDKYLELSPGQSKQSFEPSQVIYGYPQTEIRDIIATAVTAMNKIDGLIGKIDSLIQKFEQSEGTLPKLIKDPSLYNNLNAVATELKKLTEEIKQGSLGKLSRDKELYSSITNTVKNLEEFSNKISSSHGSLGKLINEPELYNSLVNISQRLDNLLNEIEKSQGTLSLLLRDKQTAEDLKQSVREIKELIEEIKKNPKKFFKFSVF